MQRNVSIPNAQDNLKQENYPETEMIPITDNYQIEVPVQFIDSISLEIMALPVLATDGQNYEASQIASHLAIGNCRSPLTGTKLQDTITFNLTLYNQIRDFFQNILERDHAVLNDGNHQQALAIIKKHAEGMTQSDEAVSKLIDFCKKKGIIIYALETALPIGPIDVTNPVHVDIAPPLFEDRQDEVQVAPRFSGSFVTTCLALLPSVMTGTLANYVLRHKGIIVNGIKEDLHPIVQIALYIAFDLLGGISTAGELNRIRNEYEEETTCEDFLKYSAMGFAVSAGIEALGYVLPWWAPSLISIGTMAAGCAQCISSELSQSRFSLWHHQPARENNERQESTERLALHTV